MYETTCMMIHKQGLWNVWNSRGLYGRWSVQWVDKLGFRPLKTPSHWLIGHLAFHISPRYFIRSAGPDKFVIYCCYRMPIFKVCLQSQHFWTLLFWCGILISEKWEKGNHAFQFMWYEINFQSFSFNKQIKVSMYRLSVPKKVTCRQWTRFSNGKIQVSNFFSYVSLVFLLGVGKISVSYITTRFLDARSMGSTMTIK